MQYSGESGSQSSFDTGEIDLPLSLIQAPSPTPGTNTVLCSCWIPLEMSESVSVVTPPGPSKPQKRANTLGSGVVGAVDQILGSILSPNGSRINLLLDNLGRTERLDPSANALDWHLFLHGGSRKHSLRGRGRHGQARHDHCRRLRHQHDRGCRVSPDVGGWKHPKDLQLRPSG